MKEALERIDSGILISMNGNPVLGDRQIETNLLAFRKSNDVRNTILLYRRTSLGGHTVS